MDNIGVHILAERRLKTGFENKCNKCKCKHLSNVKRSELFSFVCAVISTVACIFTVICSTYTNRAPIDIKEQCNNLNGAKFGQFPKEQHVLTRNTNFPPRATDTEYENANNIDTRISDEDATRAHKLDKGEIHQPHDSYNKFTGKNHLRIRRAPAADLKSCRNNCKGARIEKRKCKKDCKKRFGKPKKPKVVTISTQVNLPAAHFEANIMDTHVHDLVRNVYTKFKSADEKPLQIFKKADWVGDSSPVELTDDSVAVVKSSGIFFVYAQVFIGNSAERYVSVVHKKGDRPMEDELSCYNNQNGKTITDQTCSVSGLMKLDQGDTVEVQRSIATKNIEIDKDKTFFGLVQLSGIVLK